MAKIKKYLGETIVFKPQIQSTFSSRKNIRVSCSLGEKALLPEWTTEKDCGISVDSHIDPNDTAVITVSLTIPPTAHIKIYDVRGMVHDKDTGERYHTKYFLDEVEVAREVVPPGGDVEILAMSYE